MDFNQKIIFLDTVFIQEVDDEIIVLDTNTENYFGLNKIGSVIWQTIKEKQVLDEVYKTLLERYDADAEVLRADLENFVVKLLEGGLAKAEEL
ncbi:MAG: PqqD family protein [Sulfurovaceae bacterium]|nr:PqqD family protein [Sulfurovaceae bacterium]